MSTVTDIATRRRHLGPRLVAFRAVGYCDRADHEIALITDGIVAYATGPHTDGLGVARDMTVLTVNCNQPDRHDEPCEGQVTFDLVDEHAAWTADADVLELLDAYGEPVDMA